MVPSSAHCELPFTTAERLSTSRRFFSGLVLAQHWCCKQLWHCGLPALYVAETAQAGPHTDCSRPRPNETFISAYKVTNVHFCSRPNAVRSSFRRSRVAQSQKPAASWKWARAWRKWWRPCVQTFLPKKCVLIEFTKVSVSPFMVLYSELCVVYSAYILMIHMSTYFCVYL